MSERKCPYCIGGRIPEAGYAPAHRCPDCEGTGYIPVCDACGEDAEVCICPPFPPLEPCEDCGEEESEGECPECSLNLCDDCLLHHHNYCKG